MDFKKTIWKPSKLDKVLKTNLNSKKKKNNEIQQISVDKNFTKFNGYFNKIEIIQRHSTNQELLVEVQLMNKVIYQHRSQQKKAKFYKKLAELKKHFERLDRANVQGFVSDIRQSFFTDKNQQKQWDCIPTKEFVENCSFRLKEIIKLLIKIEMLCKKTYLMFMDQVRKTFFMNLALVVCGIVSRINVLVYVWKGRLLNLYTILYEMLDKLSNGEKRVKKTKSKVEEVTEPGKVIEELQGQLEEEFNIDYSGIEDEYVKAVKSKIMNELVSNSDFTSGNKTTDEPGNKTKGIKGELDSFDDGEDLGEAV
ncbi:hypothetical protein BB559_003421 [Furculomyces boomerangus]|uniref:Nucleolus and neural progenitor protein-like N-terminal domain-containing protein n=2 Tax=Harpellales TaxID=61421 RepID=A0A2T9YLF5_9FUNG|nr:hypothetical protein BB559_003421 [Furculomyces boomerangus]